MCSVLYTTTGTTNQDVVATLTGCNEPIVITNNSGNANYTFTGNGFFLYFFRDIAGNLSVAPAVVTWIDKTLPQALSLTYIPATLTTGSVTATLTVDKVVPTPIGWQGNTGHIFTKIFTGNTSGTVTFSDVLGNANTTGFEITRIDTCNGQDCIITGSVSYTPTSSTPTSGTVTATLTLNMPGTLQTPGWTQVNATQFTKIYTGNTLGGEILSFQNSYGYTGSVNVEVTRIDRIPPTCTVTYSTTGSTNQNVQTSLINCSEPIVGSTMYLFTGNGVYFFTITDVAGNIAILPAVVTWIDKTVPQIIHLTYTPSTATNGNVEVSITLNEAGIIT
ncbi:hypothetical protein FACS1894176_01340 [Bacteroidia bacterium]|nr:hypothetical protein FACS189428_7010 [Clostridia bacterium]GHV24623.1 hypothetical protein FACS1894176_01340 [Bacteroidia bacterium]